MIREWTTFLKERYARYVQLNTAWTFFNAASPIYSEVMAKLKVAGLRPWNKGEEKIFTPESFIVETANIFSRLEVILSSNAFDESLADFTAQSKSNIHRTASDWRRHLREWQQQRDEDVEAAKLEENITGQDDLVLDVFLKAHAKHPHMGDYKIPKLDPDKYKADEILRITGHTGDEWEKIGYFVLNSQILLSKDPESAMQILTGVSQLINDVSLRCTQGDEFASIFTEEQLPAVTAALAELADQFTNLVNQLKQMLSIQTDPSSQPFRQTR